MTNYLACLGLSLYRFRQCAFYGPAFEDSGSQRAIGDSNFGSPVLHAKSFSMKFKHVNVGVRWCSQGFFNRPSIIQAAIQRLEVDSNLGSPICQTESFSLKRNHPNEISILGLLFWCCPSAVFRRITFRAIDSVNAVRCGRLRSHVGVEGFKRIPSLAYCDAVSSVARKGFVVRVIAALLHLLPRIVLGCSRHSVSLAACLATLATVPSKSVSANRSFCSALARNIPVDILRWMVYRLTENRPFTKSLPSQVYKVVGATIRIAVSHDSVPLKQVVVRTASQLQLIGCSYFSTLAIREQR